MQNRFAFGLVVIYVWFSLASSMRMNSHAKVRGPDDQMDDIFDCVDAVDGRSAELLKPITAYFTQCEVSKEHLIEEGRSFTVTSEGKALICKDSCKGLVLFSKGAPDSSTLLEDCDEEDSELTSMIRMHSAFDAARKSCAETPSVDVEDEDMIADEKSVEEVVAPIKGKRIKQQQFEYNLKSVLAPRSKGDCAALKTIFKVCDYKKTGMVLIQDVDKMLDVLEESQKQEALGLLRDVAAKAGKPDTEPLTFEDWTRYKLSSKQATKCALEYAMKK